MPTAKLPLPADRRVLAFRKFVQILQDDPILKRAGIHWYVWDGSPDNTRPAPKGRPWVRLTPSFGPAEPMIAPGWGTRVMESPVIVKVETHVPDNWLFDNSGNLWGAIEAALYPSDPAARTKANADRVASGLADVMTLTPAADVGPEAVSVGQIQLTVFVNG